MGRGYVFTGQICHQIIFRRQQLMYWPTYSLGNLCHQMLRSMPSGAIVLGPGFRTCSPLVIDSQFCTCTRTMAWSQIKQLQLHLYFDLDSDYAHRLLLIHNCTCTWIVLILGLWHNTTCMVKNVFRLQIVLAICIAFVIGPGSFELEIDLHSWWCITINT